MMREMTLENIAKACQGIYYGPAGIAKCAQGIVIDSRLVEKDYIFVAVKGEKVDGHSFVSSVMEKGALAVIVSKKPETDCPHILVEDTLQALQQIAAFYRSVLSCKVVGITGSVGKTSTKEMIAGVLSSKFSVLKTAGNYNNEIGVPLTIFRLRDEHEVAVIEMGISDFGEMSRLTKMVRPDIGVITNIGECHLENLGDRDGVLKAKTEMFEGLSPQGEVVLNGQDDKLITIREVMGKEPHFFGNNTCYADNIVSRGLLGTTCQIHIKDLTVNADIRVYGPHQVKNAMAAVCVAQILGLSKEEIEHGISSVMALDGRGKITETKTYTVIDEGYNANPASMKATLYALSQTKGRKVAILGDMFELGTGEAELHAEVGKYAAECGIDCIICIGNLARYVFESAKSGNLESYYYETKDAFFMEKDTLLCKGDVILVKASHGMHFEEIKGAIVK